MKQRVRTSRTTKACLSQRLQHQGEYLEKLETNPQTLQPRFAAKVAAKDIYLIMVETFGKKIRG